MFCGKSVLKKVRHLSGGERIRLKPGKLLYEDVNLLILDEPTNHLDNNSIETFEEALKSLKELYSSYLMIDILSIKLVKEQLLLWTIALKVILAIMIIIKT